MAKKVIGVLLMAVAMVCFFTAMLLNSRMISDVVHLRRSKAKRALGNAANALATHPTLHPFAKRQSSVVWLLVIAGACFLVGLGVLTNP